MYYIQQDWRESREGLCIPLWATLGPLIKAWSGLLGALPQVGSSTLIHWSRIEPQWSIYSHQTENITCINGVSGYWRRLLH